MLGLRPGDAHTGSKCVVYSMRHASPPRGCERGEGTGVLMCCEGMIGSRWRVARVFVDARQRTRGCEDTLVSILCCGWHIRHPRVHVPTFTESYLPAVESTKVGQSTYKGFAADCQKPTLVPRCGFRQRLTPSVRRRADLGA